MARGKSDPCTLDMTPMIDVTFQLIIFFIVTIKLSEDYNKEIELEMGKDGATIEKLEPGTMVVEVDKAGNISLSNFRVSKSAFRNMVRSKYNRMGQFAVVIRGDRRTRHQDIRTVMDILTESNIYKIQFAAIKEPKSKGR